ncbi:MAG: hypothetical protein LPK85_03115, partial [Gammaproteobacteria bacterium]|nr:hypothetical protein [Gammaproteobacteria bacterium]
MAFLSRPALGALLRRLSVLALCTLALPAAATSALTPAQQAELASVAPGVALTEAKIAELRAIAFDTTRTRDERVAAMRAVSGFPADANIRRRVCIWDIFGRSGPIFAAAQEQRAVILQYGVDVEMVPYTSETVMVEELKSGLCDAALMSGLRARLFNTY